MTVGGDDKAVIAQQVGEGGGRDLLRVFQKRLRLIGVTDFRKAMVGIAFQWVIIGDIAGVNSIIRLEPHQNAPVGGIVGSFIEEGGHQLSPNPAG